MSDMIYCGVCGSKDCTGDPCPHKPAQSFDEAAFEYLRGKSTTVRNHAKLFDAYLAGAKEAQARISTETERWILYKGLRISEKDAQAMFAYAEQLEAQHARTLAEIADRDKTIQLQAGKIIELTHNRIQQTAACERLLAEVLEQINLAQENWDTAESTEAAFDTLRECVAEVFRG